MNILRSILIGLASFIFIVAVTGYVYTLTLHTTIMDRAVVKDWLNTSQLYDGRLISALVQTTNAGGGQNGAPQPPANTVSAPPEVIESVLNTTFPADFTRTHIETVVDNAYDWMDGTTSEFTFSIPIDQKRDTLIAELAKSVEPQVATLPVCPSAQFAQQVTCRPANVTVAQLANQLITQNIDESGAFATPLTNKSFSTAQPAQPKQTTLTQLPAVKEGIDLLLVALPIAALISLVVIIFATRTGQRLLRTARLFRRVFFGMLFMFVPAAILVWLAKDNDFGLSGMFAAQTGELVIPLIKTIAVGILGQLALISGIVGLVSAIIWIALSIWRKNIPEPTPQITPTPQPVVTSQPQAAPTSVTIPEDTNQPPTPPATPTPYN